MVMLIVLVVGVMPVVGIVPVVQDMRVGGLSAVIRIVRIMTFGISTARENCGNPHNPHIRYNPQHYNDVKKQDNWGIGIAHSTRISCFPECRGISGTIQPIGADGTIGIISTMSLV